MWRTMMRIMRKFSLWGGQCANHIYYNPEKLELLFTLFYRWWTSGLWRIGDPLKTSKFENASLWLKQRHLHSVAVLSVIRLWYFSPSTELSRLVWVPSPGQSTTINYTATMPLWDSAHLENSKKENDFPKSSLSENFLCAFNFLQVGAACCPSLWDSSSRHHGLPSTT